MTEPIYIQNKYLIWYNSIIEKAKNEDRIKGFGIYYENHHIIPESLGGSNNQENLILLTAREHFICHYLLTKFSNSSKMIYAFNCMRMNKTNNRYFNSRLFESNKIKYREVLSKTHKNKFVSQETRLKISRGNTGKIRSEETKNKTKHTGSDNGMYGKHHSKETKLKISEAKKGTNLGSDNPMYGKDHSIESKLKISEANKQRIVCPHCNKIGGIAIMKRWHFDNCKLKEF